MRTAALHNLGCRVNEYETEAMRQLLLKEGYAIVPFEEKADVYVVNTCTVTSVADKKSRQMLHRAKKINPDAVVVACGCYVQDAKEELLKDGAVDLLIGTAEKEKLIEVINGYLTDKKRPEVGEIADVTEYGHLTIERPRERTRAFLKIQDGCDQYCAYCRIPYVRGHSRSKSREEVLAEVDAVLAGGCREIVLSGIHLSSYPDLAGLIREVGRRAKNARIRLGSLEMRLITRSFVQQIAAQPNLCPQFHLSLQSGCNPTLARMNRHYTVDDYRAAVEELRNYFTDPAITTDIIVGFPGETYSEFQTTLQFARSIGFAKIHIFKYSARPGTKAYDLPDPVDEEEKTRRARLLAEAEAGMRHQYMERIAAHPVEVLFEESKMEIDGLYYSGHTEEGIPVRCSSVRDLTNRIFVFDHALVRGDVLLCDMEDLPSFVSGRGSVV